VSVRDGLLALMTLGPAYGLQLHAEFLDRAAHRSTLNPGQVYQTLDRLIDRGLVDQLGLTDDGLPLYTLTSTGAASADAWLSGADAARDEDWDDVLDRLLIASSIPGTDLAGLAARYRGPRPDAAVDDPHPQRRLAGIASGLRADALDRLLDEIASIPRDGARSARGFASERPRRGRRSTAVHTELHGDVA
jgi:DNA-binding PadR family transcriptional regulator